MCVTSADDRRYPTHRTTKKDAGVCANPAFSPILFSKQIDRVTRVWRMSGESLPISQVASRYKIDQFDFFSSNTAQLVVLSSIMWPSKLLVWTLLVILLCRSFALSGSKRKPLKSSAAMSPEYDNRYVWFTRDVHARRQLDRVRAQVRRSNDTPSSDLLTRLLRRER